MTKELDSGLYYIALIPPRNIYEEVQKFQLLAEKKFGSKLTQRSPAHITLVPPFRANNEELNLISKRISASLKQKHHPIDTMITGFYHFNYRTIIMEINKSRELEVLFADLMLATSEIIYNVSSKFVPHITIAKRDLSPEIFDKAYDYFGHVPFTRSFMCDELDIFHFENGRWNSIKQFALE